MFRMQERLLRSTQKDHWGDLDNLACYINACQESHCCQYSQAELHQWDSDLHRYKLTSLTKTCHVMDNPERWQHTVPEALTDAEMESWHKEPAFTRFKSHAWNLLQFRMQRQVYLQVWFSRWRWFWQSTLITGFVRVGILLSLKQGLPGIYFKMEMVAETMIWQLNCSHY